MNFEDNITFEGTIGNEFKQVKQIFRVKKKINQNFLKKITN